MQLIGAGRRHDRTPLSGATFESLAGSGEDLSSLAEEHTGSSGQNAASFGSIPCALSSMKRPALWIPHRDVPSARLTTAKARSLYFAGIITAAQRPEVNRRAGGTINSPKIAGQRSRSGHQVVATNRRRTTIAGPIMSGDFRPIELLRGRRTRPLRPHHTDAGLINVALKIEPDKAVGRAMSLRLLRHS